MKKTCVGCGKTIPAAARICVFCCAKQMSPATETTDPVPRLDPRALEGGADDETIDLPGEHAAAELENVPPPASHGGRALPLDGQLHAGFLDGVGAQDEESTDQDFDPSTETPTVVPAVARAEMEARLWNSATPRAVTAVVGPGGPKRLTASAPSQTADTLLGLDRAAILAARGQPEPAGAAGGAELATVRGSKTNVTLAMKAVDMPPELATTPPAVEAMAGKPTSVVEPGVRPVLPALEEDDLDEHTAPRVPGAGWSAAARLTMALAGAVLVALFLVSYPWLVTFTGNTLVLHIFFLVGGVLFLGGAAVPLPSRMRGAVATGVGGAAVFLGAPLLAGFAGWRGFTVALVFCALPGGLFLRARAESRLSRALVAGGIALVLLLYLAPTDGVMPITAAIGLLTSGSLVGMLTSLFFLVPMILSLLALTALPGGDTSRFAALWAVLLLLYGPGAIIVAGVAADDPSLQLGVALVASGATAAIGLAQALVPNPRPLQLNVVAA